MPEKRERRSTLANTHSRRHTRDRCGRTDISRDADSGEDRGRGRHFFEKAEARGTRRARARAKNNLVDSVNRIQRPDRPRTSLRHRLRPTPATLSRVSRISVTTPLHSASPFRSLPTTSLFRRCCFGCVPFGDATLVGLPLVLVVLDVV